MTDPLFQLPVRFHSAVSVSDYTASMDGRLANGELEEIRKGLVVTNAR
jgi:hypothetical protein